MKKCSVTIDTRKTDDGRYIAYVMECVNGKLFEYSTLDFDNPYTAYRNAISRLGERHWIIEKNGKTEFVNS